MDESSKICKVFIPSKCLSSDHSGILFGLASQDSMCITSLLEMPSDGRRTLEAIYAQYKPTYSHRMCILGVWDNRVNAAQHNAKINRCLRYAHALNLPLVHLRKVQHGYQPQVSACGPLIHKEIVVIVYDIEKLAKAIYLTSPSSVSRAAADLSMHPSNLSFIAHSFVTYRESRKDMVKWMASKRLQMHEFVSHRESLASQIQNKMLNMFHWSFLKILTVFLVVSRLLSSINGYCMRMALSLPACLTQVNHHYNELHHLAIHCKPVIRDGIACLRLKNSFWRHVFDVTAGTVIMTWLASNGRSAFFADYVMNWAQNVASELQCLLDWMMGAPAGLKLNSELAHFLGKFFLYHIYLWTGYLNLLKPFWRDAVWFIGLSGCLGLSMQLSLVQDLLSMMTLHIYCFYVYAARLYRLQVYGLASLWRLFRGKKWNVLRQRVDSASYNVDQLFLGTLLFTMLLFLLPTTLMFYSVFAALRVLVLILHGSFHTAVAFINAIPVYTAFLRIFNPDKLSDDVHVYALHQSPGQPLYLAMQFVPACWTKLWSSSTPKTDTLTHDTWSSLGKKLLLGHLIYPWIQSNA